MSREFRVNYATASAMLYVIIRRTSDSYVWNGSAFEVWSNANIANYDVPLTDRGGDLYDGDFPSGISASDYRIDYYEQAGGSPATTDLFLKSDSLYWNGTVATSGSTVDLSAYALSSLENQKRYMHISDSSEDTLLTQIINAVSLEIERVCGIQFIERDRRERLNGNGQKRLTLNQWPVNTLTRMSWGWGPALTVGYTGAAIRAEVGVSSVGVKISSTATTGIITSNTFLFADYPTVALLRVAIAAVSGWSATVNCNTASADLNPLGGADAKSRSVILSYPDRADILYRVEYATGLIELESTPWMCGSSNPLYGRMTGYESEAVFPAGHQFILVEYNAGFAAVPADVELMCNGFVADAFYDGQMARNTGLMALGPFTWKASKEQVATMRDQLAAYIDLSRCIGGI